MPKNIIKNDKERHPVTYEGYRCAGCEKLLFKGLLVESEIEVKCKRCNKMNTFCGISEESLLCFVSPCPYRIKRPEKEIP